MLKSLFDVVDVACARGVAKGAANEGWEVADFVEVVMGTEVASASHDSLFAEGGTDEVRIHAINIEAHSGVGFLIDKMDPGLVEEKIVEFLGVGGEVGVVFFGTTVEPVESSAEGDNLSPGLKAGLKNSVGVVFVLSGEKIVIGKDVINHTAADEGKLKFGDKIAAGDDDSERGSVHFVGGETDGVSIGFFEHIVIMRHGLGGVDNDDAAVSVDFFDNFFEIEELAAIKIGSTVDDNDRTLKVCF